MKLQLTIALVLALVAGNVAQGRSGVFFTGNEMLEDCSSSLSLLFCDGYVFGVYEGYKTWERPCIPVGVTSEQMVDVFIKYLEDHPESRHNAAYFIVQKALSEAWPCKR